MQLISLSRGLTTKVDDADYEWLNQWKWCAAKSTQPYSFYASRKELRGDKWVGVRMHRLIMNFPKSFVDHRDGDTLNNQRSNLRTATPTQNCVNSRKYSNNTSGYTGVYWAKRERKWLATVQVDKKMRYLGLFGSPEAAAQARDAAAALHYGEYARLNFEGLY